MRYSQLPNLALIAAIGIGALYFVLYSIEAQYSIPGAIGRLLLALIPIAGVYGVLWRISNGAWVGKGDAYLGIYIALVLPWQSAFLTLVLANLLGLLWVSRNLLKGGLKKTDRVPFGPFLIVATGIALLFGEEIIRWYFNLAGI